LPELTIAAPGRTFFPFRAHHTLIREELDLDLPWSMDNHFSESEQANEKWNH
jgi:hypothetical protein